MHKILIFFTLISLSFSSCATSERSPSSSAANYPQMSGEERRRSMKEESKRVGKNNQSNQVQNQGISLPFVWATW